MSSRRTFIQSAIGAATVLGGASRLLGGNRKRASDRPKDSIPLPVNTPDVQALSFTIDNGVKVFQLTAEPVKRKIAPWKTIACWGFNGSCPGPTIQVNQGDRVRLILENHLPESTAIHWHGLEIPYAMDGMPYLSQKPIAPGSRFAYEFTVHQNGTFFYHSHSPMQQMMGMVGLFILHPQQAHTPAVDHDFGVVLQEWAVLPNNTVPNTANMEWNWLTFNGAVSPMTTPLIVRQGSRVRIRMVNIGMDHHPVHLHGHTFVVTGTEAGRQPESTWGPGNTVLVGVAQARDIEFVANNPGDWMIHCHLPHHMMNSMMDLLSDRALSTTPLSRTQAGEQMNLMMGQGQAMEMAPDEAQAIAANAASVPGFPQDGLMEMQMDDAVSKGPEFAELPPGWSAGMQGMMSLLRIMPPDQYERYLAAKS